MHDIKSVRLESPAFDAAMARRGFVRTSDKLLALDATKRAAAGLQQEAQSRRNALAREIGQIRRVGGDTSGLEQEATALRARIDGYSQDAEVHENLLHAELQALPNVLDRDVPDGSDESANLELNNWGKPRDFDFTPRQHFELG